MFKNQECHKTLYNHSLILENKYIFLFSGGAPTVGTPYADLCFIKHLNLLYDGTENKRRFHA